MSGVVLVTGAAGYIGRRLCERLASEMRVRALVRSAQGGPWSESVRGDLTESELPAGLCDGVDVVYHLAARTHALAARDDERRYWAVNVDGTRRLREAARRAGVRRMVLASSVKAAGEGGAEPVPERDSPLPSTPYGRSKREAEELVLASGPPEGVVVRLAMVYGPNAPGNLTRLVAAIYARRLPPLPEVANRRSMIHVDDAVAALALAGGAPSAAGRRYTATDGEAYSSRQIYEAAVRASGRPVPGWSVPAGVLRSAARLGDVVGALTGRRAPFDSEAYEKLLGSAEYEAAAIRRELGFSPRWTLPEALPDILGSLARG